MNLSILPYLLIIYEISFVNKNRKYSMPPCHTIKKNFFGMSPATLSKKSSTQLN